MQLSIGLEQDNVPITHDSTSHVDICVYICIQTISVNNTRLSLDSTDRQQLLSLTFNERCTQETERYQNSLMVSLSHRVPKSTAAATSKANARHIVYLQKTPQKAMSACHTTGQHEQERHSRKPVAGWLLKLLSGCMGVEGGRVLLAGVIEEEQILHV